VKKKNKRIGYSIINIECRVIGLIVRTGQRDILDLLAPDPVAVDAAHDDGAVLVYDADALTLCVPRHPTHHALVPVVDHLLVPGALPTGNGFVWKRIK
jgi:hypothetical protein